MDTCESKNNEKQTNPQNSVENKRLEALTKNTLYPIDTSITEASKSLCKLSTNYKISSGFFIQLFKGEEQFFCLMTCEHAVKREMIEQKQEITILYELEKKMRKIRLNTEERIIKDFKDITIDATVIEILPTDNIPQDYFVLPLFDYNGNYNKMIGQEITIIQYPKGKMYYSYGNILRMEQLEKAQYEFAHDASTDNGSSGSPIFLKDTTRVVGIHKSDSEDKKENYGDFIWPIFCYFKNFQEKIINAQINKNNLSNESNQAIMIKNVLNNDNNIYRRNNQNIINNINSNIQNNTALIQNDSNKDKFNEITLIYEISSYNDSIRLFGDVFV